MVDTMEMTNAQQRYLLEIGRNPGRKYNGRARRPLEALRKKGFIRYDFELVPQPGGLMTERFTCFPISQVQAESDQAHWERLTER